MPRLRRQTVILLFFSALLTVLAAVPVAYLTLPIYDRWRRLGALTDPDLARREQALNYLIRTAEEPAVVRGALRQMRAADAENFHQIVAALDRAGQWRRPVVPDDVWLRWLGFIAGSESAESRILATQNVTSLTGLADDARVRAIIERSAQDKNEDVRYNALVAAARMWGFAREREPYAGLIHSAAVDTQPAIARHAWLMLGLIGDKPLPARDWRAAPPVVAEAILWATHRADPAAIQPAADALADASIDPSVRAMAAYALHQSTAPQASAIIAAALARLGDTLDPDDRLLQWRLLLSITPDKLEQFAPLAQGLNPELTRLPSLPREDEEEQSPPPPPVSPSVLAMLNRLVNAAPQRCSLFEVEAAWPLPYLAALEGLQRGACVVPVRADTPDMLRLAALDVTREPKPEDLRPLLASSSSTMRDLACLVAADRFTAEQNEALVASLLRDYNDHAKMSGAILAGLTSARPTVALTDEASRVVSPQDLLTSRAEVEDQWPVLQLMRLGLWMQGRPSDEQFVLQAPAMLARDDLPRSTIMLALLHRGHWPVVDELLNPMGEVNDEYLIDLLDRARWWRVLHRFLPADAPPIWPWGDRELVVFQLEVLREWWLLHGPAIKAGKR